MSLPIPSEPVSYADFREFYNKVARLCHYPECWDTAAYPTLYDAIYELRGQCTNCGMYLPAEEPAPSCETCYIQDYWPDGTRPSQCDECEEADARVNWRPAELPPKEEVLDEPKVAPAEEPKDNSLPPCCYCVNAEGTCGFERLTCTAQEHWHPPAEEPDKEVEP